MNIDTTQEQKAPERKAANGKTDEICRLAVFDFDGTSISGNSPVILVKYLFKKKMISFLVLFRIIIWAFAYKFRLPQDEFKARRLVFSGFKGTQKSEADLFLRSFYLEHVDDRFREQAQRRIDSLRDEGYYLMLVSASFDPIVEMAKEMHRVDSQISTKMKVDTRGAYTCEVEGYPVEGEQKIRAVTAFANERFGEKNWELAYAFGDHHSDIPLLEAAQHPFAICPNHTLEREAQHRGWPIEVWE